MVFLERGLVVPFEVVCQTEVGQRAGDAVFDVQAAEIGEGFLEDLPRRGVVAEPHLHRSEALFGIGGENQVALFFPGIARRGEKGQRLARQTQVLSRSRCRMEGPSLACGISGHLEGRGCLAKKLQRVLLTLERCGGRSGQAESEQELRGSWPLELFDVQSYPARRAGSRRRRLELETAGRGGQEKRPAVVTVERTFLVPAGLSFRAEGEFEVEIDLLEDQVPGTLRVGTLRVGTLGGFEGEDLALLGRKPNFDRLPIDPQSGHNRLDRARAHQQEEDGEVGPGHPLSLAEPAP